MKTISEAIFNEVKAQNRKSVVKSLKSFLTSKIVTLAKNSIVEIESLDFLKTQDFHYHKCKEMTDSEFAGVLDVRYILHGKGRSSKILIKIL